MIRSRAERSADASVRLALSDTAVYDVAPHLTSVDDAAV